MKGKKISTILALILGLTALSGCTNSDQKVNFGNFWQEDALSQNDIHETLVYDVTFDANDVSLVDYTLAYKDGKYTTSLVSAKEDDKTVYTYTTALTITAQYTLNGVTEECQDVVTSTVKFYAAEYGLQPISSEKEIKASSPTAITGTQVSECYQQYHYATKITYNENCTEGKSVVTHYLTEGDPKVKENTFEIEQKKFSYLDNEQVLLALRGVRNSTSSAKLNVYSAFAESVQKVSWTFDKEVSAEFSFYKNGGEEKTKSTITYRPVNLVLDEKNPGATQIAWIAKKPEASSTANTNRNVILRLETPLSYGLGSLIYTLNSVSYK
jgi:outer membrane protein assembly factor BamE (lipoprotein component of BamABCDE complex)